MPASIAATSSRESGLVRSTPETSPAKHGPIWRMLTVMGFSPNTFSWRMFLIGEPVPTSPEHALFLPALHRPFELRGRPVGRPHRFVFLALELDQIGRRQGILAGRVEFHAAV